MTLIWQLTYVDCTTVTIGSLQLPVREMLYKSSERNICTGAEGEKRCLTHTPLMTASATQQTG